MPDKKMQTRRYPSSYRLVRISVFSALSVIGSFIHLPGPIPTIAFDSSPGFFAALYFGASDGALVSGIGHMATSIVNGFPLGIFHLPISLGLAAAGAVIGMINRPGLRWSVLPALASGVAINSALVVVVVPVLGWAGSLSLVPFLALASTINAIVAAAAYAGVKGRLRF